MRKSVVLIGIIVIVGLILPLANALAESPARPMAQNVLAKIDSPLPNGQIRNRVQIKGSATHPLFDFYKVEFGPGENPSDDQMSIIGAIHNEQITNGLLETWDTAMVPDGTYTLRLRVVDKTGNYQEYWVRRLSVANTKPPDTPTPSAPTEPDVPLTPRPPTVTPTNIAATPTIMVERPFMQQSPTPPLATQAPAATAIVALAPTVSGSPAPTATSAAPTPTKAPALTLATIADPRRIGNALCFGSIGMAFIFLLFGSLSLLRRLVLMLFGQRG